MSTLDRRPTSCGTTHTSKKRELRPPTWGSDSGRQLEGEVAGRDYRRVAETAAVGGVRALVVPLKRLTRAEGAIEDADIDTIKEAGGDGSGEAEVVWEGQLTSSRG
jgi:hypothetical protein